MSLSPAARPTSTLLSLTPVPFPTLCPVCSCRLPHGAVHPVVHHHARQAAHPEQPVWDRHTVSSQEQRLTLNTQMTGWTTHRKQWEPQKINHLNDTSRHFPGIQTHLGEQCSWSCFILTVDWGRFTILFSITQSLFLNLLTGQMKRIKLYLLIWMGFQDFGLDHVRRTNQLFCCFHIYVDLPRCNYDVTSRYILLPWWILRCS